MSDLLGNLAAKALNMTPLVEPRPLSRFEPWQPSAAAESTPTDLTADVERPAVSPTPVMDQRPPSIQPDQPGPMRAHTVLHDTQRPSAPTEARPPSLSMPMFATPPAPAAMPEEHRSAIANAPEPTPVEQPSSIPGKVDQPSTINERIERVIVEHHSIEHAEPDRSRRDIEAQPGVPPRAIGSQPPTVIERVERLVVEHHAQPLIETRMIHDTPAPPWLAPSSVIAPVTPQPAPQIDDAGRRSVEHAEEHSKRVTIATPRVEPLSAPQAIVEPRSTDRVVDTPPQTVRSIDTLPSKNAVTNEPSSRPRPAPIIERATTLPIARQNPRPEAAPLPAPPTIHVSIGRVEVRAMLPPTPAKRSSSSTTVTSLEEYMRRRAGDKP